MNFSKPAGVSVLALRLSEPAATGAAAVLTTGEVLVAEFDVLSAKGALLAQPDTDASKHANKHTNKQEFVLHFCNIRINSLNSLSNRTKTYYDKADIKDLYKNMTKPPNLKSSGLKATLPRLKILEIFQNSNIRHLSAEDVYKILLSENMDVGLATVYRVLTQFEQAEIIHRNHFETGKAVFELNEGSHHDHLVCLNCGRVEEFYDPDIEQRQHAIAAERGFTISDHSLAIYGNCNKKDCQNPP